MRPSHSGGAAAAARAPEQLDQRTPQRCRDLLGCLQDVLFRSVELWPFQTPNVIDGVIDREVDAFLGLPVRAQAGPHGYVDLFRRQPAPDLGEQAVNRAVGKALNDAERHLVAQPASVTLAELSAEVTRRAKRKRKTS